MQAILGKLKSLKHIEEVMFRLFFWKTG